MTYWGQEVSNGMALRSLSLCAGIGGIDLGLRGIARTVCYVEREAFAAANLVTQIEAGRLDPAPVWSDLRSFDARAWRGRVDLVTGGYPCQPFSLAGKRLGKDDPRHLWPDVLRVLEESEAPLGFFENVRGHVSKGLSDVLGDLARVGFDVEWGCLSAAEVGAPHRRDRLWILAHRPGYLANAVRRGQLQQEGPERAERRRAGDCVSEVGHAESERRGEGWAQQQGRLGLTAPNEPVSAMGHADLTRLEGRCEPVAKRADEWSAWPPGPEGDWTGVPTALHPAQCDVCGVADGLRNRVDRLRALGNAVVPAVARRAFCELVSRASA